MNNLLALVLSITLLTGCSIFEERIVTDTIEVSIPVPFVPEPPVVQRPSLLIQNLNTAELGSDGTVVKNYKATIFQLLDYIEQLETVVESYRAASRRTARPDE